MAFWNLRTRVALLWLVITLLVVGVVAWAICAEVVMAAMRDQVRKNGDTSSLRLHQNYDNSDTSDDFSIHRVHNKVGDSAKKSSLRHSKTTLLRQDKKAKSKSRSKPDDSVYSYDERYDDPFASDEEPEEALESAPVPMKKALTTKKPSVPDKEKALTNLTEAKFVDVIHQLMAQTKARQAAAGQVMFVSSTPASAKKQKSKTTQKPVASGKKPSKAKTTTTTTTTTTPSTTTTPTTTRPSTTTIPYSRAFNHKRIQSLSLKLSNSGVTTTKPKKTKIKVSTIKIRRTTTTSTTTPSTTTTIRTTTRRPTTTTKSSRSRNRKPSLKSFRNSVLKTTTVEPPTTISSSHLEKIKSKIRQKELQFLLNKVESLEKQQKDLLKHSEVDTMASSESISKDSFVKPNIEVIPFNNNNNNKYPDFSFGQSPHKYNTNSRPSNGWTPTVHTPVHSPHIPPPPMPPMPNAPPPPPPPPFHRPHGDHNLMSPPMPHQMSHSPPHPHSHHMPPPPPPPPHHSYPDAEPMRPMMERPVPEPHNRYKSQHMFNGVLPIPNNRGVSLGGADLQEPQESHPMAFHMKGPPIKKSEKPGIQLSFGGGPMGGGGQLKTSPMGIFKTLLLPLLPKPRMNLNGKVVFGVVLENGVGFGKKPKVIAQHFSTGHI